MDIPVDLAHLFPSFIVRLTCHDVEQTLKDKKYAVFWVYLDEISKLSSVAQDLKQTLTSSKKLAKTTSDVLYVLWAESELSSHSVLLGFLKCGRRPLYFYNNMNECKKYDAVCLLDFYVHHTVQRMGYGKVLFDLMLKGEGITPNMIAIDKPSDNLLCFLSKHYGLINPIWQANNYVILPGFFDSYDKPDCTANGEYDLAAEYAKCMSGSRLRRPSSVHWKNGAASTVSNAESKDNNLSNAITKGVSDQHCHTVLHLDHVDALFAVENQDEQLVEHQDLHQHPDAVFGHESSATDSHSPAAAHTTTGLAKERKLNAMCHHKLW